jgi:hypothetical protein
VWGALAAILMKAGGWFLGKLGAFITWAFQNPAQAGCLIFAAAAVFFWHEKSAQAEAFTKTLQAMTADRDAERTRADKSEEGRKAALAANVTLDAAVKHLEAQNAATTKIKAAAEAAGLAALADLSRTRAALKASQAREAKLRSDLYATDPDVSVWGAAPVPRALADRLLESARQTAAP